MKKGHLEIILCRQQIKREPHRQKYNSIKKYSCNSLKLYGLAVAGAVNSNRPVISQPGNYKKWIKKDHVKKYKPK